MKSKSKTRDSSLHKDQTQSKKPVTPKSSNKDAHINETKLNQKTIASEAISEIKDDEENATITPQSEDSPKTMADQPTAPISEFAESNNSIEPEEQEETKDEDTVLQKEAVSSERKMSGRERPKSARPKSSLSRKENFQPADLILNQNEIQSK